MASRSETRIINGRVPIEQIARAHEMSGVSYSELARRLGWFRPDYAKIARALGHASSDSRGKPYYNTTIDRKLAVRIIRELGLDPVDFDL